MGDKNAIELIGFPVPFHLIFSSKKLTTTQKVTARKKMGGKNAIAHLKFIGFSVPVLVRFRFSKKATKT